MAWIEYHKPEKSCTLVNLLNSKITVSILSYRLIALMDPIRYLSGPLPEKFCYVKITIECAIYLQILLLLTAINATKYLFAFVLKNPLGIIEGFWSIFIIQPMQSCLLFSSKFCSVFQGNCLPYNS